MVDSNNAINNTIGASISGVTNTLTVTNPSNTASSQAKELITVGGGTAGDPWVNFNVSGVTNWSYGIDNDSSDDLKISQAATLGTLDSWVMGTDGQRNLPRQSCFKAQLSANVNNVTGDGTVYTVIFDDVEFDVNGDYNNATGIFTAPVDGKYLIIASVGILGITAAHVNWSINFSWTGGSDIQPFAIGPMNKLAAAGFVMTSSVCTILDLSAMDQVFVYTLVQGGTKTVDIYGTGGGKSTFCAFLLS